MSYQRHHWRLYNIGCRVFGLMAGAVAAAFIWSAVSFWLGLATFEAGDGGPVAQLVAGVVSLVLSVAALRRRPYRPDQGDVSWWAGLAGGYDQTRAKRGEPRSWWTGEYRDP